MEDEFYEGKRVAKKVRGYGMIELHFDYGDMPPVPLKDRIKFAIKWSAILVGTVVAVAFATIFVNTVMRFSTLVAENMPF